MNAVLSWESAQKKSKLYGSAHNLFFWFVFINLILMWYLNNSLLQHMLLGHTTNHMMCRTHRHTQTMLIIDFIQLLCLPDFGNNIFYECLLCIETEGTIYTGIYILLSFAIKMRMTELCYEFKCISLLWFSFVYKLVGVIPEDWCWWNNSTEFIPWKLT
jgi:hypothetical protein